MPDPWYLRPMLAYDTETSGVDTENDRIVTAACWFVGGGKETSGFETLLNPGVEIAKEATAVHGITTEDAAERGEDPAEVLPGIALMFAQAVEQELAIVVFNAPFDLTMLDRELRRHGLDIPEGYPGLVVDPFVLDKHTDPFRRGSRKLEDQCKHHRVQMDGAAHGASADAVASARLAFRIARDVGMQRRSRNDDEAVEVLALAQEWERVRGDLPALVDAQMEWAADQRRGLAKYFESKGNKDHGVRTEWPLIPWG